MVLEEILKHDETFRYQLLSRMAEMQSSLELLNEKIDGYEQRMVSAEQRLRLLHTASSEP